MSEEFKNDFITATVTRKPDCVVEIAISATPEMGQKAYNQAIKNIKKEVSFPGFRKGKAPDDMVKSQYGPQIEREFKEIFLNDSVKQALDLTKLFPWNRSEQIKADMDEASTEKGGKFKVTFEAYPEIPDIDPSELKVEKVPAKEVTDDDLEKHILSLRYHHADWKEVEDQPIEENNRVEVSVEVLDEENQNEKTKNQFHINRDYLEDWLYDLLIGKKAGESQEVTPPAQEGSEEKNVRITIDKVTKADIGELDEEFVKKFGAESVEDFKQKISDHLKRQEEEKAENQFHAMIQQKLNEKYHFDVPASIVNHERQNILTEMIESLKRANYTDEAIQNEKDKMEELSLRNALQNLRTHYILLKIAEDQKFNISREEIMNELIQSSITPQGTLDMEKVNNPDKYSAPIIRKLQLTKAMEYLAEKVSQK